MLNRSIDFAIILNGTEQPRLITQQLMDDQVYLCVADSLLRACYGERAGELKEKAVHGAYVEDFSALLAGGRPSKNFQPKNSSPS